MAVPFLVGAPDGERLLSPVVTFESEETFAEGFDAVPRPPRRHARRAPRARTARPAWAQEEFDALFRERVAKEIAQGGHRHVFGILGRPYTLYDPYLNLGLFERLRRLGRPRPFRSVSCPGPTGRRPAPSLPWRFPADVHEGAIALATAEGIHPVVLSSFGCGPDALRVPRGRGGARPAAAPRPRARRAPGRGGAPDADRGVPRPARARHGAAPSAARPPAACEETFIPTRPVPGPHPVLRRPRLRLQRPLPAEGARRARPAPSRAPRSRTLGEKHSLGKECHAFSMIAGDLLSLAARAVDGDGAVFYFPGTSIPCLLHEYGRGMEALLGELGIEDIRVCSPSGAELIDAFGIDAAGAALRRHPRHRAPRQGGLPDPPLRAREGAHRRGPPEEPRADRGGRGVRRRLRGARRVARRPRRGPGRGRAGPAGRRDRRRHLHEGEPGGQRRPRAGGSRSRGSRCGRRPTRSTSSTSASRGASTRASPRSTGPASS